MGSELPFCICGTTNTGTVSGLSEAVIEKMNASALPDNGISPSILTVFGQNTSYKPNELGFAALVAITQKKWPNSSIIKVRFLNGDAIIQQKVIEFAKEWTQYAYLLFDFGNHPVAHIRIAFNRDFNSSSVVGTDALNNLRQDEHTMNLNLSSSYPDYLIKRVVLHEFGHAIGMEHEHQSPVAGINWNKPAVYASYASWSVEEVENNLLKPLEKTITQFSKFDRYSIMCYAFPPELTTDGFYTPWNSVLSAEDKAWAAKFYPPPKLNPDLYVRFISLECIKTEDYAGSDEVYLIVNGDKIRIGNMNNGHAVLLAGTIPPVLINPVVRIELYDADIGFFDRDDLLGHLEIRDGDVSSERIPRIFDGQGAKYILTLDISKSNKEPTYNPVFQSRIVVNHHNKKIHKPACKHADRIDTKYRIPKSEYLEGSFIKSFLTEGYKGCYYCMKQFYWKKKV